MEDLTQTTMRRGAETYSDSVVLTEEHLHHSVEMLLGQDAFAFDVETVGDHRGVPQKNQITWISLATYGLTVVIPMGHPNGNTLIEPARRKKNPISKKFEVTPAVWSDPPEQLRPSVVFDALRPLMFSDRLKIAHNASFDLKSVVKYFGELPPPPYADTIVMAWLVNENKAERGRLGLKELTEDIYKRVYDVDNVGRKVEIHPFNVVAQYAYMDAKYDWLHYLNFADLLLSEDVEEVFVDLEMPVLEALLGMPGVTVDKEMLLGLREDLSGQVEELKTRIYRAAGRKFNLNSNPQKNQIFYGLKSEGGQGLKPWMLTDGGLKKQRKGKEVSLEDYSTKKEALEKWPTNKVVKPFLEYQEVERILTGYVHSYLGVPGDPKKPGLIFDGKVYPEFVQYGTVTGRFSCRSPNLQNIPRPDTDLGRKVRSIFVAPEGHSLVVADYGQVELVLLAHFVGQGALYQGFFDGVDPHTITASLVFDTDVDDVTKVQRQDAKNINFAVVYGAGADKVARMSKTSVTRAKSFLNKHQREFPEIYKFKDKVIETCRSRNPPHIKTLLGRKRRLPEIWASDFGLKSRAERQAVNSLIQGSSADLIKVAMIRLHKELSKHEAGELILTVHDELVTVTPTERVEDCEKIVREAMTGSGIQELVKVPLTIDLKTVQRWSDAK